jgi:uncharacterized membrane protein
MLVLTTIPIAVILIVNSVQTVGVPDGLRKTDNAVVWNAVENAGVTQFQTRKWRAP